MPRYAITVQPFNGPGNFGEAIHGQLVDTEVDLSDPIGYYLLLRQAASEAGNGIVGETESGNVVRLADTVEQ